MIIEVRNLIIIIFLSNLVYNHPLPTLSITKLSLQHLHRIHIPTSLLNRLQRRQAQLPLLLISLLLPPRLRLRAAARRNPRQNPITIMRRVVDKIVEAGPGRFRGFDVAKGFG